MKKRLEIVKQRLEVMQKRFHPLWMPLYRWLDFFVQKPSRGLALLMGLQVLALGVMATFFNPIPDLDILLNSLIGLHGEDAHDKRHPHLPYVVNHWLHMGEPLFLLPHYVVAQLFVIATYGVVYQLGVVLFKNKVQALAATLLLVGLYEYYKSTWFVGVNHNVMMYPFWALIPLLTFYATRPLNQDAQQHRWWLLLGFVMGMPVWVKYQIALLLVTVGLWVIMDKEARAHLATPYPYGALLIFVCVAAVPLEQAWQYSHAIERWGKSGHDDENFWLKVITKPKFMLFAVLFAGLISWKTRLTYPFHTMTKRETHFLCFFALMPFIVLFVIAGVMDASMRFYWTAAMYPLWSLLLVALVRAGWRKYSAHVILLLALYLLLKPFYKYPFTKDLYLRLDNPQVVAEKIVERWRQETNDAPMAYIFGDITSLGGVLGLYGGKEVKFIHQYDDVYPSRQYKEEVKDGQLLRKEGALFVFHSGNDGFKDGVRQEIARFNLKEQKMKIDEYPHVIYYAILPPAEP